MSRSRSQQPKPLSVTAICRRLEKAYGPVHPPARLPVVDELVATILSQNTSDANSGAAFDQLRRRFGNWDSVRRAPAARIATAIRHAGLANQKAPRIKAILQQIHQQRGRLSLDFLCDLPTGEALDYLRSFQGVGPKTERYRRLRLCGSRRNFLPSCSITSGRATSSPCFSM